MEKLDFRSAVVPAAKVTHYLLRLDHPEGVAKARFFLARGFESEQWDAMADCLRAQASGNEISKTVKGRFGSKIVVEGPISCPDGTFPVIRTVWMVPHGTTIPRLVTAHPLG